MKLAGIAGVVAMLVFLLPASVGANETPLEHEVRAYLQANGRFHTLIGIEDGAELGRLTCGRAGRFDELVCEIPLGNYGVGRFRVSRTAGRWFELRACHYVDRYYFTHSDPEDDPCYDDITRG
jgi:hypothetical protein